MEIECPRCGEANAVFNGVCYECSDCDYIWVKEGRRENREQLQEKTSDNQPISANTNTNINIDTNINPNPVTNRSPIKFCQNCGTNLPNESKFCPSCGSPIGTVVIQERTNTIPLRVEAEVIENTKPRGEKPQEKEALKYQAKSKRSLIFIAIWGAVCIWGIIRYNATATWFGHLWYGFLIFIFILGLISQIAFLLKNRKEYEKYKDMSDREWNEELIRRKQNADFAKTVATNAFIGFIRGFFYY